MKLSQSRRWLLLFGIPLLSAAFAPTTRPSSQIPCIRRHLAESDDTALSNPPPTQTASSRSNLAEDKNGGETQESFSPPPPPAVPFEATGEQELPTTLGGGTALMFEMIRLSVLEWNTKPAVSPSSQFQKQQQQQQPDNGDDILPRWRPHAGVSDINTAFRTEPPSMNNEGFARTIWRNLRKRNKPSLWRNSLRTYDRMAALEAVEGLNIRRSNIHHEGAMLACAKLGLWQRALEIYHCVYQKEQEIAEARANTTKTSNVIQKQFAKSQKARTKKLQIRRGIKVSDDMIFSLVKACVRASFQRSRNRGGQQNKQLSSLSPELEEQEAALRRIPLDTALEVLSTMEETHSIPIVAHYVNPLAKAYQSLGYVQQARDILQTMLSNRTAGEEPEDGTDLLNVFDFSAKDKGSYSLLVQGSVVTGDWGAAVQGLGEMIDAGLYPNKRHSNIWSEISEGQTRPRAVGSWKKKRDDFWTDSVI
jgi:hypothetical protein